MHFNKVICKDLNIYAFGEGLPIENYWVRFSWFKHIHYPRIFHSWNFLCCRKLVYSITFETNNTSCVVMYVFYELQLVEGKIELFQTSHEIGFKFSFLCPLIHYGNGNYRFIANMMQIEKNTPTIFFNNSYVTKGF